MTLSFCNFPASKISEIYFTNSSNAPSAPFAALEVDEMHLPAVAGEVNPEVLVLLNLSRDQLDGKIVYQHSDYVDGSYSDRKSVV